MRTGILFLIKIAVLTLCLFVLFGLASALLGLGDALPGFTGADLGGPGPAGYPDDERGLAGEGQGEGVINKKRPAPEGEP